MPVQNARILVVDDDEAFRRTLLQILKFAGFEGLEADSMTEVLAALDRAEPVDLVLADLRLAPGTPHGFSIARVVQMRYPHVKIVFMTGGDAQGFALGTPDDVVLQKPFKARDLVDTIRATLGISAPTTSPSDPVS
jgi:DNA-binding NtrC family response regulator